MFDLPSKANAKQLKVDLSFLEERFQKTNLSRLRVA